MKTMSLKDSTISSHPNFVFTFRLSFRNIVYIEAQPYTANEYMAKSNPRDSSSEFELDVN